RRNSCCLEAKESASFSQVAGPKSRRCSGWLGQSSHLRRPNMTQVYFHCSNTKKVFVDCCSAVVDDHAEARDHATRVVESFTCERSLDDWREDWVLHVSDDR